MNLATSQFNHINILFLLLLFFIIPINATSLEISIITAQGGSKSSGNEMLKAIVDGTDFKGMTKQQIVASYGEPGQKDTAGEKGRYDEKWTYSCETHNGLDYDCVFLYFMEDRVVDVENF